MFSARKHWRHAALAVVAGALALPATAQAGVVVKSSGPSAAQYPVGTKLNDDATITLREGDRVTVLTSSGTRVLSGAGTYRVGDRATNTRSRFAALTRKRAASRVRTGAVRPVEVGGPILSPNLWYVDVSRPGTMCLYDLEAVRLWRPSTEGTSTYLVADQSSAAHVHVIFEDKEMVAALDPARMSVSEGGRYMITGPDGASPVEVTFVSLADDYAGADELAEKLIEKGCESQLGLLADALDVPAD